MGRVHVLGLDALEVAHELLDPIEIGLLGVAGKVTVADSALAFLQETCGIIRVRRLALSCGPYTHKSLN
jgi:hypothetical protein